jgi:hypothetical protein
MQRKDMISPQLSYLKPEPSRPGGLVRDCKFPLAHGIQQPDHTNFDHTLNWHHLTSFVKVTPTDKVILPFGILDCDSFILQVSKRSSKSSKSWLSCWNEDTFNPPQFQFTIIMAVAIIQGAGRIFLKDVHISGYIDNGYASFQLVMTFRSEGPDSPQGTFIMDVQEHHIVSTIYAKHGQYEYIYQYREVSKVIETLQSQSHDIRRSIYRVAIRIGPVAKDEDIQVVTDITTLGHLIAPNQVAFDFPVHVECGPTVMSIDADVISNQPIKTVIVPSLQSQFAGSRLIVRGETISNQLSIVVETCDPIMPSAITAVIRGQRYIAYGLLPVQEKLAQPLTAEFLIVLDNSWSMNEDSGSGRGPKLDCAKRAMISLIRNFPVTCFFNVIIFNSTYFSFFPQSVECSPENIGTAEARLSEINADGGTNLLDPMTYLYSQPTRRGCVSQVFLLTDGEVESRSQIIELVAQHRSDHRINCFGIGEGCDVAFFGTIARDSGGRPEFINGDNIQSPVAEQWKHCLNSLTDTGVNVKVAIEGIDDTMTCIEITPSPVASLFSNSLTPAFMRIPEVLEGPFNCIVTGQTGDHDFRYSIPVRQAETSVRLDQLFGLSYIKDCERGLNNAEGNDLARIRAQIVQESRAMGISSPFTERRAVRARGIPRTAAPLPIQEALPPLVANGDLEPVRLFDFEAIAVDDASPVAEWCSEPQPVTEAQAAAAERIHEVLAPRIAPNELAAFVPAKRTAVIPQIPRQTPPPPLTDYEATVKRITARTSPAEEIATLWNPAGLTGPDTFKKCGHMYSYKDSNGIDVYAVKQLKPNANNDKIPGLILLHISQAESLNHRRLLSAKGVREVVPGSGPGICMAYMSHGSVEDWLKRPERNDHTRQTVIMVGSALALNYLHQNGHIHGGLRPSNIFIDGEGNPIVADFLDFTLFQNHWITKDFVKVSGEDYSIPEEEKNNATNKVDIFLWGLLAIIVFVKRPIAMRVSRQNGSFTATVQGFSPTVVRIINECLSKEPKKRPSFDDILKRLEAIDYKVFPDVNSVIVREFIAASITPP